MKKFLALSALLMLPSLAFAASFANAPLFLSRTPVTQGQTVRIIAVIENNDANSFSGLLVFFDGTTAIGTSTVTLGSGATQTASVPWSPAAGTHTINAELISADGTVTQQISSVFTISAPPTPTNTASGGDSGQSATVDSSQPIQQDISNVSPQAAQAAQPAFAIIDGLRASTANVLQTQLATAKQNLTNTPQTSISAGGLTQNPTIQNPWGEFWFVLWTVYFYVLTILLYIIDNAAIFYPVLVIIFFYLLYRTYRWARRPSY